ncbi:MAG: thiamine pyrophosphate-dependent enzyme, partial [Bacillota bacterium]
LKLITKRLNEIKYVSDYTDEIKTAKKDWQKEYERLAKIEYSEDFKPEVEAMKKGTVEDFIKATGGYICQTSAIALIRETIDEDAIVVGASGSLPGCLQRMWNTDSPESYNMEYGYSCMGYEIAGALGSKLARKEREVYAFVGDGSYLMLNSEMVTAVQEGVKINILLFDNSGFGCINNLQMGNGINSACTEFRYRKGEERIPKGEFLNIDYAKNAEGYGYKTYQVKTMKELKDALEKSKQDKQPTLIDIKVMPKTMTSGYGGWWNVGCSSLPRNQEGQKAYEEKINKLKKARKY